MRFVRRVLAVARLRAREGMRGPVIPFLVLLLVLSSVAALAVPGVPGPDRQRAVDAFVLDATLLVLALAAAVLGGGSLSGDRETGREAVLAAGPTRTAELVIGGFLGHAACLGLLLLGAVSISLATTGLLAGGESDRTPTRVLLRADELERGDGKPVEGGLLVLSRRAPEATYVLPQPRAELGGAPETTVRVFMLEMVDGLEGGFPVEYPVGVKVDDGPERIITRRTENPLTFTLEAADIRPEGGTRITVRRIDPAYSLGVAPGGLSAEGPVRSFTLNLAKGLLAWTVGLLVILAAAQALSSVVGAQVATAGALLLALLGRSLDLVREALSATAAGHGAEGAQAALPPLLEDALRAMVAVLPDFHWFDLTRPVTARWNIEPAMLLARGEGALLPVLVLLAVCWLLLALRRRI